LPKLSTTMEEGTILSCGSRKGSCAEGEPLFELETDKAAVEVEAPFAADWSASSPRRVRPSHPRPVALVAVERRARPRRA